MFFCISYLDVLSKVYQSVSSNESVRGQGQGLYFEKKTLNGEKVKRLALTVTVKVSIHAPPLVSSVSAGPSVVNCSKSSL